MTRLTKAIQRIVPLQHDNRMAREVTVTLYPGGTIGFKPLRSRGEEYTISLSSVYTSAIMADARTKIRASTREKKVNRGLLSLMRNA